MKKQRPLIIAILATLLIVGGGWINFGSRRKVYQGNHLDDWLQQYATSFALDSKPELQKEAETVIQQIGTNTIPIYLDMIASRESPFRVKLLSNAPQQLLKKLHIQNMDEYQSSLEMRRISGAYGLIVLGPDAKPAIPAIITLIQDEQLKVRRCAVFAARNLGPAASNAIPSLIKCLQDPDRQVQADAAVCLGRIHGDPQRVIPVLLDYEKLHREDPSKCASAIHALGMFGSDAKVALPMITKFVDDKNMTLQGCSLRALYAIDPQPETFLPMLLKRFHSSDKGVRKTSAGILSDLFPEEAEKAGVYKTYPWMKQGAR